MLGSTHAHVHGRMLSVPPGKGLTLAITFEPKKDFFFGGGAIFCRCLETLFSENLFPELLPPKTETIRFSLLPRNCPIRKTLLEMGQSNKNCVSDENAFCQLSSFASLLSFSVFELLEGFFKGFPGIAKTGASYKTLTRKKSQLLRNLLLKNL